MRATDGIRVVVGVDPSLTSTGVVVRDVLTGRVQETFALCRYPAADRNDAYCTIVAGVLRAARRYLVKTPGALLVIEDYAVGSGFGGSIIAGVETQAIIRHEWLSADLGPIIPVPANVLKKFVTGRGTSDKSEMRLSVFKQWGFEAETHDEVDAFGLSEFGLCLLNHPSGRPKGADRSLRVAQLVLAATYVPAAPLWWASCRVFTKETIRQQRARRRKGQ